MTKVNLLITIERIHRQIYKYIFTFMKIIMKPCTRSIHHSKLKKKIKNTKKLEKNSRTSLKKENEMFSYTYRKYTEQQFCQIRCEMISIQCEA